MPHVLSRRWVTGKRCSGGPAAGARTGAILTMVSGRAERAMNVPLSSRTYATSRRPWQAIPPAACPTARVISGCPSRALLFPWSCRAKIIT